MLFTRLSNLNYIYIRMLLGSSHTGIFNSILNPGTAEPFGIAPAKPVAYIMELIAELQEKVDH